MHKLLVYSLLLLTLTGCSTKLPDYIQDHHPYKKRITGDYNQVLQATQNTLVGLGWPIDQTVDPNIYEVNKLINDPEAKQTLLFTQKRKSKLTLGRRYSRLNVFVRSMTGGVIEIEIRYMGVTALPLKKLYDFKNDKLINRVFKGIEERLNN